MKIGTLGISRAFALVVSLLLAAPALATVVVEYSLEKLSRDAEVVVIAEVEKIEPIVVDTERGRLPFQLITLRVEKTLKGKASSKLQLAEFGGLVDGKKMQISGTAEYRVGERVVTFAESQPFVAKKMRTLAMKQGKFRIGHSFAGTPEVAYRDLKGISLLQTDSHKMKEYGTHRIGLQRLVDQVQQSLRSDR